MFLESFQVSGFKSLRDVRLDALKDVNVFHGNNNVGKSNILQAIDVFFQLLPIAAQSLPETYDERLLTLSDLLPYTESIFQNSGEAVISWRVRLRLLTGSYDLGLHLTRVSNAGGGNGATFALRWLDEPPVDLLRVELQSSEQDFNLIPAVRRVSDEWLSDSDRPTDLTSRARHGSPVEAHNLKRALFDSAYGEDLKQRERFRRLAQILTQTFGFSQLDAALGITRPLPRSSDEAERYARDIVIRFLPGNVRLEDMGSGVQQLLLLLGQVLFNPARLVGIEEPEMNLGPDRQGQLARLLHDLTRTDGGVVDQVFITSHSPSFEEEPFFYDVTYTNGET
ncbi:MAG TPA: AAA family ATPase, partial [Anaerolineae bacterium]